MTVSGCLKFVGALAAAGVVILALRVAISALAAYLRLRAARLEAARDPFPAVHTADEGERPDLICLPGGRGRNGRQVYRRAYPGRHWN